MSMSELESGSATVGGGEGGCHHTDLIRSCWLAGLCESMVGRLSGATRSTEVVSKQ